MKRTYWSIALVGIFLFVSAASAKADQMLDYTLTADGSSSPLATWQMSMTPTPSCPAPGPCYLSGVYFAENVNISLEGAPAIPDTLVFFNSFTGLALNDLNFDIPEFLGDQLYTMDESAPTMSTGSFALVDDGTSGILGTKYTLDVSAVPEPSSILLLATGLICVSVGMRRRRPVVKPR